MAPGLNIPIILQLPDLPTSDLGLRTSLHVRNKTKPDFKAGVPTLLLSQNVASGIN